MLLLPKHIHQAAEIAHSCNAHILSEITVQLWWHVKVKWFLLKKRIKCPKIAVDCMWCNEVTFLWAVLRWPVAALAQVCK